MVSVRASDRAYLALRDAIINLELLPGTALGEVEQSERLGVSRTPLREALSRLVADGLVMSQSGRGLVVTAISVENIRELFEVRQALESQAAALAALRREQAVFDALEQEFLASGELLEGGSAARHAYYDLIRRFDEAVDDATRNAHLVGAIRSLRTHLVRIRRLSRDNPTRLAQASREHLVIVQAIASGDPEFAADATRVHLHRALESALRMTAAANEGASTSAGGA